MIEERWRPPNQSTTDCQGLLCNRGLNCARSTIVNDCRVFSRDGLKAFRRHRLGGCRSLIDSVVSVYCADSSGDEGCFDSAAVELVSRGDLNPFPCHPRPVQEQRKPQGYCNVPDRGR